MSKGKDIREMMIREIIAPQCLKKCQVEDNLGGEEIIYQWGH